MKKFEWRWVKRFGDSKAQLSLLELTNDGHVAQFWAVLKPISDDPNEVLWTPIMLNKERNGYITIKEELFVDDLKDAVLKQLMDMGIGQDGDEVTDYTTEE